MKQVTLVMLYGPKPNDFTALIRECQNHLARLLGDCFQPYELHQVHATLLTLEQIPGSGGLNLYFSRHRGESRRMDIAGFLTFLRRSRHFPLYVKLRASPLDTGLEQE